MSRYRNRQELLDENGELRQQLEETQDALRAIRSGEVDALLVSTDRGDRVFTIQGADEAYRVAIENVNEGVATFAQDGTIVYANRYFSQMVQVPLNRVLGMPMRRFVASESFTAFDSLLSRGSGRTEISLADPSGTLVPVYMSLTKMQLGSAATLCAVLTDLTEQKLQESIIAEGTLIQSILAQSAEAIVILGSDGSIIYASGAAEALCHRDIVGESFDDAFGFLLFQGESLSFAAISDGKIASDTELSVGQDGEVRTFLYLHGGLASGGSVVGHVLTLIDTTERKRREEKIIKLTRLYAVLSRANEAIVRIRDINSLYSEICRIVAEESGYPLVWIGQVEEQHVIPLAWSGPAADYLKELKVEVQGELGRGPTGTCIRENRAVVNDDFATNATVLPWREAALSYSFRASAAFPLRCEDKVIGALTLYSFEPNTFDADQIRLLESLASDVSYALDSIDEEKRRIQAEEALRESEELFRAIADRTPDHILVQDASLRYTFVANPQVGLTEKDMLGKTDQDILTEEDAKKLTQIKLEVMATGKPFHVETSVVSKEGELEYFSGSYVPKFNREGLPDGLIGYFQNVTARKKAEQLLEKTRFILSEGQNIAHVGSFEYSAETKSTVWSDEEFRIYGLAPGTASPVYEVMLAKFIHPDDAALLHETFTKAVESGSVYELEHRIVRPNGEIRTVYNKAHPHFDENGNLISYVGATLDITERKQAGESLRETRDYLDNLLNYARAPVIVWDPELRITKFNRASQRLTGYREAEVVGRRLDMLFPEESREESLSHIHRAMEGERWETVEIPILRIDGEVRTILWNSANIHASDGVTTVATIAQGQDITERKQAEEQLRFQADVLTHLFDAVVAVDNDYRVTYWNKVAEELYGIPAEQAIGHRQEDLYQYVWLNSKDEQDSAEDLVTKGHWTGENIQIKKTGERVYVRSSISVITDQDGMQTGIVAVTRDRTKQWQAEQEVKLLNERLRQQAEDRLRATDASFRRAIASSADGIVVIRKDGVIRFANPAAGALFGRTAQEMAGSLFGFPLGEGIEIELLKDNAEKAVVEMRIVELDWEDTPAYLATLRDITRRKENLLALQESETRLRLLLDQIPCLTWTLDTKLRFTSFTGSVSGVSEAVPDQILGMTLAEYFKVDELDFTPYVAHRQALQGTPTDYELSWAGRTFYGRVESLSDADDLIVGIVGVALDITERKRTEEQLRNLSHRLVTAQENERRRIARELHDEVGQSLTALKLYLDKASPARSTGDVSELEMARETLRELLARVRSMSVELRPNMLDELGLLPTLLWHFKRYTAQTNVHVHFKHRGLRRDLPQDTITTAYRIVQEALTNVARYAQVTEVTVCVRADFDALVIEVEDHGVGFDLDKVAPTSMGLSGMHERALSLKGKLLVQSASGEGTCVLADLPLAKRGRKRKEQGKR